MQRILLLVMSVFMLVANSSADNDKYPHRKKVAVVLSGGGAKGVAHIGALSVIEKAGIPIDYIVGTSMGSIVGGLYAIGYDAHKLDSIVRRIDWSLALSDRADVKDQTIDERDKQLTYIISKPLFSKKSGILKQSGGLVRGDNLANLFTKLTVGYHDSIDFKNLPIPFACVATDIVADKEVVLNSGNLATAMRASMSIPAVFTPVRKDSMVLVDGGMKNNFPVDVARAMGADVVIGVSVQSDDKKANELRSGMDIIGQLIDITCKSKFNENWADTDVPVKVDVEGYSAVSFTPVAIDTLVSRGEKATMEKWDELMALKKAIGVPADYIPPKHFLWKLSGLPVKIRAMAIDFDNVNQADENYIRRRYHLNEGDSISSTQIEQAVTAMRGFLFYRDVKYELRPMPGGYWLLIKASPKRDSEINVGVRFDSEEMVSVQANYMYQLHSRQMPVNLNFTGRLGKRILAEVVGDFNPLNFTRFSLSYRFRNNDLNIYYKGDKDYNMTFHAHSVDLRFLNMRWRNFMLEFGVDMDYYHYSDVLTGEDPRFKDFDDESFFSYIFRAYYDSERNGIFTDRGSKFELKYQYHTDNMIEYNHHSGFSSLLAMWRKTWAFNTRFTLQPMLYGRMLFGSEIPVSLSNVVGGNLFSHYMEQQLPFAGMRNIEYMDDTFIAFSLQARQRISDNHYIFGTFSMAYNNNSIKDIFNDDPMRGYRAAYYYDSLFGPIGGSVGYSSRTKSPYFFVNLGYDF